MSGPGSFFTRPWDGQPQDVSALSERWVQRGLSAAYLPAGVCGRVNQSRAYSARTRDGWRILTATDTGGGGIGQTNTFFIVANLSAVATDASAFGRLRYNAANNMGAHIRFNNAAIEINKGNNTGSWSYSAVASAVTVGRNSYAGTAVAGVAPKIWKNGVRLTPTATQDVTLGIVAYDAALNVGQTTVVGATAVTGAIGGGLEVGLHFLSELTDADIAELHANPWQVFEPRRIFVPVASAGGSPNIAATVSASASSSAALTTSIRLAGSVSASASSSAALTATIRLAASVSGSSTATAALTTGIRAAAAISGTATASAALTVGARMAAGVSGSATTSAALTTSIRLAAGVSASATASADLTAGAANALAAAAIGQATASAALTTAVRMQASAAASATATADLTTSSAAWAAAVIAQASASASLTTAIRLAAVANASASAAAALSGGAADIPTMPPYVTVYLWKRTA